MPKITKPEHVYLDTSIFLDYIKRNVKTALKEAIIQIRKRNGETIRAIAVRAPLGHSFNELSNLKMLGIVEYFISPLTIAEVVRNLRKDCSVSEKETIECWNVFRSILELKYTKNNRIEITDEILNIILKYPPKKNIQDMLNIFLAKQNDCSFLTADKLEGNLLKLKENFYEKIMPLKDFLKMMDKKYYKYLRQLRP